LSQIRREVLGENFLKNRALDACRLALGVATALAAMFVMVVVIESTRGNVGEDVFAVVESGRLADFEALGEWKGYCKAKGCEVVPPNAKPGQPQICLEAHGSSSWNDWEVPCATAPSTPPALSVDVNLVIERSEEKGQWGRRLLAWSLGVFVGGGILGAPLTYILKKKMFSGMVILHGMKETMKQNLITWAGACLFGLILGSLCLWVEISLEQAQVRELQAW
jgi:hypothetical protein